MQQKTHQDCIFSVYLDFSVELGAAGQDMAQHRARSCPAGKKWPSYFERIGDSIFYALLL
ncbi:hypothetical protein [Shewanella psychrophila]|uniref:hypothetical protein n=1 Tax=Shewanella psychrophila TaxID=225848 RepID=UPI000989E823|nr:hypothetical protein [Shewanella psychrophila]